jgi:hypothetical protein
MRIPNLSSRDIITAFIGAALLAIVLGGSLFLHHAHPIHPVWWITFLAVASHIFGTICVEREFRHKYIHDLHIAALSRGESLGLREACDLANRRPTARMWLRAFVYALPPTIILWTPVCCVWGVAWAIRRNSMLLAILLGAAMGGSIWILVAIMRMLIRQDRAQSARVNAVFGKGVYESASSLQRYGMCRLVDQLADLFNKPHNGNHGDA